MRHTEKPVELVSTQSENETAWVIDRLNLRRLGLSSIVGGILIWATTPRRSLFSLDPDFGPGKGHRMFHSPARKPVLACAIHCAWLLLLATPPARAQEAWDAVFLKGNKIGYVHTFVEKVSEKGRELYRVRLDQVYTFRRLDDTVTMKMMYGTIETPEGEVLRLDTRTLTSENEIRVYGDAIKGRMNLIMEGTGQRQEVKIPWGKEIRGPYAAEQSMARKPME